MSKGKENKVVVVVVVVPLLIPFHLFSWKPILDDIESRFDAYLEQENRVNRRRMVDNRIHACIYFIAPTGHA